MRILITGGFGYVGGRLGQYLNTTGHQVVLGTRKPKPPPLWLPSAGVVQTAWEDAHQLHSICEGVDAIVHAAGMNAADCQTNPVAALEFNGVATARLAEAAVKAGVKRFIYLSTAHVYARPLADTISEDTRPQNTHPYATTHLAGENALLWACEGGRLDGTVVRLSNAVGAPTAPDVNCWVLLFCDLCKQAVTEGALTLRTNALQQRDFVTLGDVCGALEMLLGETTAELGAQVFNIGAGKSITLLDLAQLIQARCQALFDSAPEIRQLQPQAASSPLHFDIGRLRSAGFTVSGDLAGETDRMLQFCRKAIAP